MKTKTEAVTIINVFRSVGPDDTVWCYAAFTADEHDHNGVLDADTETDAIAEAQAEFPGATVQVVADTVWH